MTQAGTADPPLYVDLDGTLVSTDTLHETLKQILFARPHGLARLLLPLLRGGRAGFKRAATGLSLIDVSALPYHATLMAYLKQEKARGRRLVLATGADRRIADAVAEHLGFFHGVLASDGECNLTGHRKLEAISGESPEFDYVGDSMVDVPIFLAARRCFLVNPSRALLRATKDRCVVERVF